MLEKKGNRLVWKGERHLLEVQPWGADVIRVRATANRDFARCPARWSPKAAQRGRSSSAATARWCAAGRSRRA